MIACSELLQELEEKIAELKKELSVAGSGGIGLAVAAVGGGDDTEVSLHWMYSTGTLF